MNENFLILDFSKDINLQALPQEEEWQRDITAFLNDWFSDSEYISTSTSGSTGTAKKINHSKKAMRKSAEMTCNFLDLKQGNSALLCMSPSYIAGKMMLVRSIVRQLKLYCSAPSSHPLNNTTEHFVFSAMVPMQVENSLDKLHLINKLIIGGAQVPFSLSEKIKNSGTEIYESFGMTETISHIALKRITDSSDSFFHIMPDTKIWKDSRGCLCIRPSFLSEDIITNDIVNIRSDKEFEWLGRIDNMINSGGVNIFPEQIEKQLKSIINNDFFITHDKDFVLGEKIVLVIEGEKDEALEHKILNFHYTGKYEKPREIIYLKQFFRTPTGKIIRRI